jgi:hypothetical protein
MKERHEITVSGERVRLAPYTVKRMKVLMEVRNEIDEYIDKNPQVTLDTIDRKLVAKWWKRKGDILWESDKELPISFYESEDFESSLLKQTEDFFFLNRVYL